MSAFATRAARSLFRSGLIPRGRKSARSSGPPGAYYKVRAVYRDTSYGPQFDIRKIREAVPADEADGFDPGLFREQSRFDPAEMFAELRMIATEKITEPALAVLVLSILDQHREQLLNLPAATRNHHTYLAGYLEHVLSVTRTCVYLADKYAEYYPDMRPPLDRGLVVAGGILHDIGKLREIEWQPEGAAYHRLRAVSGAPSCKGAISSARRRLSIRCPATCYCGWSTSSSRTSGCPSGARRSRR